MRGSLLVFLAVVGCGGGKSGNQEQRVCDHAKVLCGKDTIEASCPTGLAELQDSMGDAYGKTMRCAEDAASCPELAGCFVGGANVTIEKWFEQFGKGFDKVATKDKKPTKKQKDIPTPFQTKDPFDDPDFKMPDMHAPDHDGKDVLSGCTSFKSESAEVNGKKKIYARWSDCPDAIIRDISCATFIDDLKCDCLEDGVTKWFFSAQTPPLDERAAAERIARANCHQSFGNF